MLLSLIHILVYNESYGEPYREVVEFLYRHVGFSFVPIRDDELRWGHPMLAEEYVYITKVDRGTRYYKYKQLKFPEEGEVSKEYIRAMFFLLIQSGQWEIDSIKHLLDCLLYTSKSSHLEKRVVIYPAMWAEPHKDNMIFISDAYVKYAKPYAVQKIIDSIY